jgi:hypothetical protein
MKKISKKKRFEEATGLEDTTIEQVEQDRIEQVGKKKKCTTITRNRDFDEIQVEFDSIPPRNDIALVLEDEDHCIEYLLHNMVLKLPCGKPCNVCKVKIYSICYLFMYI